MTPESGSLSIDDSPFCVLLIEDDPDTQANIRDILEARGYRVVLASDFAEALDRREWAGIGAILTDRKLPDGIAEEMLPRLRQVAPQVPVVVVTGYPDVQGAITALRQGAYDYILKPINPDALLASLRRIVERTQFERALRDREQRLQAILDTASDAIITVDNRGIVQCANPATERLFGYAADEIEGQNIWLLMPHTQIQQDRESFSDFLTHWQAKLPGNNHVVTAKRKDGSTFPIDLAVSELDHLKLYTMIIRDVSERQELQRQVLEIAAQQNRRIGHELHDNTQQQLTGLGLMAQSLAERLAQASSANAPLAIRIATEINQTAKQVHLLSRGLVPVEVDAQGLQAALNELALRISELHQVHCECRADHAVAVADNFVATHLYRIAQEAANNAIKHSHATQIVISLSHSHGNINLKIVDDGIGIDAGRGFQPGMGLRIMSYRAELIGATLSVGRRAGGGTHVACTVWQEGHVHQAPQQAVQ
jgi:two-component system, LuxR family, sensor kinase FixL